MNLKAAREKLEQEGLMRVGWSRRRDCESFAREEVAWTRTGTGEGRGVRELFPATSAATAAASAPGEADGTGESKGRVVMEWFPTAASASGPKGSSNGDEKKVV